MYKCNYCNRYLKEKYDECPGCGSTSFKKVASFTHKIIKTPPKGGYKVNINNFKYEKKYLTVPKWIGLIYIIFILMFSGSFILIGIQNKGIGIMFVIGGIFFIVAGTKEIRKFLKQFFNKEKDINNEIDRIKKLASQGMLIKNLPYELKLVDETNLRKPIYCIKVLYEIEKGRTLSLTSEPKHLSALGRDNGTVDLLIDPSDYSNYYIDFEIY